MGKLMGILVILIVQNLLWLKLEKIITIIITTMMMTKRKLNCFKKNLNFDAISHKKIHISKVHFIHCWSDFYKQLFIIPLNLCNLYILRGLRFWKFSYQLESDSINSGKYKNQPQFKFFVALKISILVGKCKYNIIIHISAFPSLYFPKFNYIR